MPSQLFFLLILFVSSLGWSTTPIPSRPYYYVLDQGHILRGKTLHAIESILIEHDHLTDQEILVGIFKESPPKAEINDWIKNVYSSWKIGKRNIKNNGLLLAIFLDQKNALLEAGFGLDSSLSDEQKSLILAENLIPHLKKRHPNTALSLAVYHILEGLNSPLIESHKAEEILLKEDISELSEEDDQKEIRLGWLSLPFFLMGILALAWVLFLALSREAHFTRKGWFRVSLLQFLKKPKKGTPFEGGGTYGQW